MNAAAVLSAFGRCLPRRWRVAFRRGVLCFFAALLLQPPALALDIQLASGDWQPINIFVELFTGEEEITDQPPSEIIARDLRASGNFRIFRENRNSLGALDDERLAEVRQRNGEYLLTGEISEARGKTRDLRFVLVDTLTNSKIGDYKISFEPGNKRLAAHSVSNWIYEVITEKPGVFHTKVVYVHRDSDGVNTIKIADYDGYTQQTVLSSDNNIISPTWTPDGNGLLYVSFEHNKPIIYRQSLLTGERSIVANFKGSNSAPAMAPDRRVIAAALTEHGGAQQIYLLTDNRKNRMRTSDAIDTEPNFSPDGKYIAFTSDEPGSPQIYQYRLEDREAKRLTFGSRYNVSPDYASDGDSIVYIRRDENGDNIAVQDIRSRTLSMLTDNGRADSPTFSPNDDMVLFKNGRKKNNLATVSINGKVIVYWDKPETGEIIDPAWSPIKSDWF